ncbi:MAG: hypothetical protein II849_00435 [Bacteroidales bacterium]|nr:hypothetical protein [Bacteroidales bacterium]
MPTDPACRDAACRVSLSATASNPLRRDAACCVSLSATVFSGDAARRVSTGGATFIVACGDAALCVSTAATACRVSTVGSATGTTGPSATSTCSQSACSTPSPSSQKHCLLRFTKRLPSVRCISKASARRPMRSSPFSLPASRTTHLNTSRFTCCASVRGLRTMRGRALRHHLPRHSYPMTVPTVP